MPPTKGPTPKPKAMRMLLSMAIRMRFSGGATCRKPSEALVVIMLDAAPTMNRPTDSDTVFHASIDTSVPTQMAPSAQASVTLKPSTSGSRPKKSRADNAPPM